MIEANWPCLSSSDLPIPSPSSTLANFFKNLAQQAKNVPKFASESTLTSNQAWTSLKGIQAGRSDRRADEMESVPENKSDKQERSYLSAAVDSISWGSSRSFTPKPASAGLPGEGSGLKNQHGGYQSTHQWHGLNSKRYPSDCPPLNGRWFYAVDVR